MTELNAESCLTWRCACPRHKAYFLSCTPNGNACAEFGFEAQESLAAQRRVEASDTGTF